MIRFTEKFPDSITIGGREYKIDTDYRIMVEFENMINKTDISDKKAFSDIIYLTIKRLFSEIPKADIRDITEGILKYYRCGKDVSRNTSNKKRCYDYEQDSDLIYAAFFQQYGDDLINSKMHWWKFRAKFIGLTDETEFIKILQYRCADISKISDPAERNRIRKLQSHYALKSSGEKRFSDAESRNSAMKTALKKRFDEVKETASATHEKE